MKNIFVLGLVLLLSGTCLAQNPKTKTLGNDDFVTAETSSKPDVSKDTEKAPDYFQTLKAFPKWRQVGKLVDAQDGKALLEVKKGRGPNGTIFGVRIVEDPLDLKAHSVTCLFDRGQLEEFDAALKEQLSGRTKDLFGATAEVMVLSRDSIHLTFYGSVEQADPSVVGINLKADSIRDLRQLIANAMKE